MAKGKPFPAFLKKGKGGPPPKGKGAAKPNPFAKGKETAKEERMEGKFKPFSKGGKA